MKKVPKEFYRPGQPDPKVVDRKARFAKLNQFVTKRSGWLTSEPGRVEVSLECLPDSVLPDELRKLGYTVTETGEGQRILAHGIVERFSRRADGGLDLLTPDSTAAVAETRTHAGIVTTKRYGFELP